MVIIFAGELLKRAESLLIMGLHPSEIIKGYELALVKTLKELESSSPLSSLSHSTPSDNVMQHYRHGSSRNL